MGSGKSSVGKELARNLHFDFIDTDDEIISAANGTTIPEIFAAEGEDGFRDRETRALKSLTGTQGKIIATGGGIILRQENRQLLPPLGYIAWLQTDTPTVLARTAGSTNRPLLNQPDPAKIIDTLLAERHALYKEIADLPIDVTTLGIADTAYGIAQSAQLFFTHQQKQ